MSTNLVLCVSDENTTVRLTKYRCKPAIFLNLLANLLADVSLLVLEDVVAVLEKNGFEVEESFDDEFSAEKMNASLLVNWAWLLDLQNHELKYWDVTAALDGLSKVVSGPSLDPLDCLQWMGLSEQGEMTLALEESIKAIQKTGISVVNY
ncbi:MAG: hypothetical protein KAQ67_01430 [Gammaproteobacteria bacterium]|nr:hypothetical protein [Gammaproteobacteria bacterium]